MQQSGHDLLERTLHDVSDAFMVFDREWRFRFINSAAAGWFLQRMSLEAENVMGRVLWDVAPQLIGTRFEREYRAAAADGRTRTFEAYLETRNAWYDVSVYPGQESIALQIRDVTLAKHRQEFLAEASRVLSETLDYRETLRRLTRLAVPRVADSCVIHVANENGVLESFPSDGAATPAAYDVFRTGKSGHDPRTMIVPLTAHGVTLGVMTFVSAESRRLYDESDVAFAEDLAARAAVAAENGRLFEEARRREREEAALRRAAESVTASFSVEEIIQQIALSALEATEADGSFVERLIDGGESVRVVAVAGEMHPELGMDIPFAGSVAQLVLETRQPEIIKVLSESGPLLPGVLSRMYASAAALAVPLVDGGEAIGTLILLRSRERSPFNESEAARAYTFGNLAALAFRKVSLLADSERKREELENVMVSRARLMRGFTHDLKNPLGAADGHASLLSDGLLGALTEKQMSSVLRIRAALASAVGLINDLMELARAESGQMSFRRMPLDVREVAREMVEQYRPAAEQAGLTIAGTLERVEIVPADVDRVRQILGNLLSNAVKYTPGGGTIGVQTRMVRSDKELGRPDCAVVDVADTGIGIPEDKIGVLFTEFERIDPTVKTGAGLGLAISRRIARLMGGDITVTSTRGSGSVFSLWLPATPE